VSLCGLVVSSVIGLVDEVGFVLCLMMRYDTIRYSSQSVRRSRQAALDDAGVRGIPSPSRAKTLTSLHFSFTWV
jgi:hypothetical protein